MTSLIGLILLWVMFPTALAAQSLPNLREDDFVTRDFQFVNGQKIPELRIHYTSFGTPKRNASGEVTNAVMLLSGSGGNGRGWIVPSLANELYGPGQALDASQYFIILPDNLGRGGSSKPSDGLKAKFPHYRVSDLVKAEYLLATEGLGIRRLRMVMGSSLGGMQAWTWGIMYPDAMDAIVPLASMPIAMSGRNWLLRKIAIEAIRNDPDWNGGDYEKNPTRYIHTAPMSALWTGSPVQFQKIAPTMDAADKWYAQMVEQARREDANNQLWAMETVIGYDPSNDLEKIKARVLAINFADDEVNPPELGVIEPALKRIAHARHVLIPANPRTQGHNTHRQAEYWQKQLADFLRELPAN